MNISHILIFILFKFSGAIIDRDDDIIDSSNEYTMTATSFKLQESETINSMSKDTEIHSEKNISGA